MKPVSADDYRFIQDYVPTESGIVLEGGKLYLIEARLGPLPRKAGMQSTGAILCHLFLAEERAASDRRW
jgi:hypothetical protein